MAPSAAPTVAFKQPPSGGETETASQSATHAVSKPFSTLIPTSSPWGVLPRLIILVVYVSSHLHRACIMRGSHRCVSLALNMDTDHDAASSCLFYAIPQVSILNHAGCPVQPQTLAHLPAPATPNPFHHPLRAERCPPLHRLY